MAEAHLIGRSCTIISASPSVPQSKAFESMSMEFTDNLLKGNKEYVSILSLLVSIYNQGEASCALNGCAQFFASTRGNGSWCVSSCVLDVIEVPSQYQADPSSEHVNKLSGYLGWNFTSQTTKKTRSRLIRVLLYSYIKVLSTEVWLNNWFPSNKPPSQTC